MSILYRARAPLRLGIAGGGTDIAAYSDVYGGAVLNATISMYAYATIEPLDSNVIVLEAIDLQEKVELPLSKRLEIDKVLPLHKGCYNRIVENFGVGARGFRLSTYVDAPPGSGLGSSSTLVVAILSAFSEWLSLPLGEYDLAHLAHEIERGDLQMAGGKQDQYAATFGGVNFIEFPTNGSVLVNPLRIKQDYLHELEMNIVLFFTSVSRYSSDIITQQSDIIKKECAAGQECPKDRLEAMHEIKAQAYHLKNALLKGELLEIGNALRRGWENKKKTASKVSSPFIDTLFDTAYKAGALGGKISGAGGGGFAFFYCPGLTRYSVIEALKQFKGEFRRFGFVKQGVNSWSSHG